MKNPRTLNKKRVRGFQRCRDLWCGRLQSLCGYQGQHPDPRLLHRRI